MTATRRLTPDIVRPGSDPREDVDYEPGLIERIVERLRPEEGWASLPLVLLLTGTMAWSISDARWILGRDDLTSFLVWVALLAALWSYLSARLQLSPWLAQAVGCTIGAFVIFEAVGASLPGARPGLAGWFQATAGSVTQAYLDLTWRHHATTAQTGHFALLLGVLVWGTAQAAAYDVFGYRRTVNGVLLLGVVLVANMSLTRSDQFVALVAFSFAALLLLLLSHSADERDSWMRHRIWRGRDFEAPHIDGGAAFASLAVGGALVLTFVASSAPLSDFVHGLDNIAFNGLNGLNGRSSVVTAADDYGTTADISSKFQEATHIVFTVRVVGGTAPSHWRMATYSTFESTKWSIGSVSRTQQILPESPIEAGTLDGVDPATPGRVAISVSVHLQSTAIKHLIGAGEPRSVNANVARTLIGDDPSSLDAVWFTTDATDYTVGANIPNIVTNGSGLTEWRLQHAGTTYPEGLVQRYTQGIDQVGPDGQALLVEIHKWANAHGNSFDNEYDAAKAIQTYLSSTVFKYNPDITSAMSRCAGLSTVDCFAVIREGFCEQYATTMTMLMRLQGYPARYAMGYLPGAVDEKSGLEQVTNQQKHAWVEVYFPTYGWIPFDPTGGGIGQPTFLPKGSAIAASPTPAVSVGPNGSGAASRPTRRPGPGEGAGSTSSGGPSSLILVPAILLLVAALALFVLWRRRSLRLEDPDSVYRDVVKLASRLGYKPRPTQTVYEYTGMLADVVPRARESLGVVATASVEVTYGKRQLSAERLEFLALAHRLVRQALLGLALRLPNLRHRDRKADRPARRPGGHGRSRN
jgi:transglutaminase-like putative cysteine protease